MMVDGVWQEDWKPVSNTDAKGGFIRHLSTFRHWITPDGAPGPTGEGGFKAEKGRYHLYISYNCPWASRTIMVRALKKLEDAISFSVVYPAISDRGWKFGGRDDVAPAGLEGEAYLNEVYVKADPRFTGRVTVPVLWDKQRRTIVNNESSDIIRMLNEAFGAMGDMSVDLYPAPLRAEIDALNDRLYDGFNNGVYRAGFAQSQEAHDEAADAVFASLAMLEERLADGRSYLFGDSLTESDIRAFVTLVRFDPAYYTLFRLNRAHVWDYPAVEAYMERMLRVPGIAETVHVDHIKTGYSGIKAINPARIIPSGPRLPWAHLAAG